MTTKSSQPTTNGGQDAAELRERLAAVQHAIWAHWMKYLFSVGAVRGKDKAHIIYPQNVARWKRQMKTPYSELSEKEKESDRDQADKVLAIFSAEIVGLLDELTEERQQRIESNALLFAAARALGLDADDIDDLPQKATGLKWDYDEAMRQYDEAQKRACEAEACVRELETGQQVILTEAEHAEQEAQIEAEQQREQTR